MGLMLVTLCSVANIICPIWGILRNSQNTLRYLTCSLFLITHLHDDFWSMRFPSLQFIRFGLEHYSDYLRSTIMKIAAFVQAHKCLKIVDLGATPANRSEYPYLPSPCQECCLKYFRGKLRAFIASSTLERISLG